MSIFQVFVDGSVGTTGLQIFQRLEKREDIHLITLSEEKRKDVNARREAINSADIVFLCLPDEAAVESVGLVENPHTRVIDASTAHRTAPGWVYGLPELSAQQREQIAGARFVANPGCHATGAIVSLYPLVALGILPPDYPVVIHSLTGYSGGGKKMIQEYEGPDKPQALYAPRIYGLNQHHKHLREISAVSGLSRAPIFCPIVDDYYAGMATSVCLHNDLLAKPATAADIREALAGWYAGQRFVTVAALTDTGFLESNRNVGGNQLELTVSGNEERTVVTARFDNLGKGASGAAVQNMNIMLGLPEETGLE
jgi:N-acetyl-gamma-glutamyl-phosphate reductase